MTWRSDLPDVAVPTTSFAEEVVGRLESFGSITALISSDGEVERTYSELASLVRAGIHRLRGAGVGAGDSVAILAPNSPGYVVELLAVIGVGARAVLLNPLDTVAEHVRVVAGTGTRMMVAAAELRDTADEVSSRIGPVPVTTLSEHGGELTTVGAMTDLDHLPGPDDVAAILQSSGSTGSPKRVLLSHRNLNAVVVQTSRGLPLAVGERVLALPPFHHAFGLMMVLASSLAQGATLVTMPRFEPEQFLAAVEKHRISRLYIVPTIASLLATSPSVGHFDLSSVRTIVSGGAKLDVDIARAVRERLGCGVAQGYGMTEAMMSFMQRDFAAESPSVGTSAANVRWRIVDPETEQDVPVGEVGEVRIAGPHVSPGYLDDDEATRASFDREGYLKSGDLGRRTASGELVLVDRIKELIKYKGHQVAPSELEEVLRTHPAVVDAAVVGVPDVEVGELPKAFVVLAPGGDESTVMPFVNAQVAPYKRLRLCEAVDGLPRTAVGKIDRRKLKETVNA